MGITIRAIKSEGSTTLEILNRVILFHSVIKKEAYCDFHQIKHSDVVASSAITNLLFFVKDMIIIQRQAIPVKSLNFPVIMPGKLYLKWWSYDTLYLLDNYCTNLRYNHDTFLIA